MKLRPIAALSLILVALSGASSAEPGNSAHSPRGQQPVATAAQWEVSFEDDLSLEDYVERIEFFNIEIAAVSKDGKAEYLAKVGQRKPEKRVGHVASDERLHIGWRKGTLAEADRKLLSRAGINSRGKELWHFFPASAQTELARLERAYAGREPDQIKRTRFLLRASRKSEGFEFVVIEQDARAGTAVRSTPVSRNRPEAP